jgi:hypothetical protein
LTKKNVKTRSQTMPKPFILLPHILYNLNLQPLNHLGGGPMVIAWDQEFAPSVVLGSSLMVAHMMATRGLHGR